VIIKLTGDRSVVTMLPKESSTATTGGGERADPAGTLPTGPMKASCVAAFEDDTGADVWARGSSTTTLILELVPLLDVTWMLSKRAELGTHKGANCVPFQYSSEEISAR
jgi:hypothetical protein